MSESLVVRISTSKPFTWLLSHVASRVDPVLFKASNGRLTFFGPTAFPMVTLTMVGRKSGKPRSVHLAAIEYEGDTLVVASSMGSRSHPGWRYNLEANPEIQVQAEGEVYAAVAEVLGDSEKAAAWPTILETVPQIRVYQTRTERNIRVFRLRRV